MAKVSHAALRALREIDHDFPARPTLPAAALCGGLAFVGRGADTPADLAPLRDTIEALWRGTLGAGADARPLLLATFVRPVPLDDASWPSGLRLAPASAATLASYRRDIAPPADNFGSRGVRTLDLWWGGKPHRIAVGALEPVPLAILWMLPRLDVHRAHEPEERSTSFASGVAAASESATAATSTVTRAGAPVAADSPSQLKEMDKRLRAEAGRGGLSRGWFGGLFGPRLLGNGSNSGGRPGPWGQAPRRGPGPLSNLLGWLRWHSPLGEPLRRHFGDRLRQVERLIASGEMDTALKLALKLGAGKRQEGQSTRYPNQLPRIRASLDFDVGDDTFTSPIFAEGDFIQLQSRYRSLADQLERDGDFRRAAYIHSQLLGDHKRAVLVLETGGMLDEAIKLAIHSRQDAVLIIRLLSRTDSWTRRSPSRNAPPASTSSLRTAGTAIRPIMPMS
jgi:hypothetical protein